MKILFIGDIVGKSGRDAVSSLLCSLKLQYKPDLVIANAENSAHGKGITYKIYNQLLADGIDYITMGNHAFSKSEMLEHMEYMDKMIIPYNHSKRTNDNYFKIIEYKAIRFCLVNILGNVLISESNDNPYDSFIKVKEATSKYNPDFYFVDLHCETTAEKRIFAEYFKKDARIVLGTHTHVQTADEMIINNECAFISDVGMCGSFNSVIGRDINESIESNVFQNKTHYTIAEGPAVFSAVIVDIDDVSKMPTHIERIQIRPKEN